MDELTKSTCSEYIDELKSLLKEKLGELKKKEDLKRKELESLLGKHNEILKSKLDAKKKNYEQKQKEAYDSCLESLDNVCTQRDLIENQIKDNMKQIEIGIEMSLNEYIQLNNKYRKELHKNDSLLLKDDKIRKRINKVNRKNLLQYIRTLLYNENIKLRIESKSKELDEKKSGNKTLYNIYEKIDNYKECIVKKAHLSKRINEIRFKYCLIEEEFISRLVSTKLSEDRMSIENYENETELNSLNMKKKYENLKKELKISLKNIYGMFDEERLHMIQKGERRKKEKLNTTEKEINISTDQYKQLLRTEFESKEKEIREIERIMIRSVMFKYNYCYSYGEKFIEKQLKFVEEKNNTFKEIVSVYGKIQKKRILKNIRNRKINYEESIKKMKESLKSEMENKKKKINENLLEKFKKEIEANEEKIRQMKNKVKRENKEINGKELECVNLQRIEEKIKKLMITIESYIRMKLKINEIEKIFAYFVYKYKVINFELPKDISLDSEEKMRRNKISEYTNVSADICQKLIEKNNLMKVELEEKCQSELRKLASERENKMKNHRNKMAMYGKAYEDDMPRILAETKNRCAEEINMMKEEIYSIDYLNEIYNRKYIEISDNMQNYEQKLKMLLPKYSFCRKKRLEAQREYDKNYTKIDTLIKCNLKSTDNFCGSFLLDDRIKIINPSNGSGKYFEYKKLFNELMLYDSNKTINETLFEDFRKKLSMFTEGNNVSFINYSYDLSSGFESFIGNSSNKSIGNPSDIGIIKRSVQYLFPNNDIPNTVKVKVE